MIPKVIFRADGNSTIGLGHVIRSLALAEMLSSEFECHFVIRNPLPSLREQIQSVCQTIRELPEADDDIAEAHFWANEVLSGEEIVVLDGYHFQTEYQEIIKGRGNKLVCIDDIPSYHFIADAIINHAGGLNPADYSAEHYTRFYLGPEYALLRAPFRKAAQHQTYSNKKDKYLLICLGGADPGNNTVEILQKCEQITHIKKCLVVVGAAYRHIDALKQFAKKSSLDLEITQGLSGEDFRNLMMRSNMAITAPSTIAYEYLCVGGTLFLIKTADNQEQLFKFLTEEGLAFPFDDFQRISEEEEINAKKKQATIFDGQQELRFKKVFWGLDFRIRSAIHEDCQFYYELANNPETRAASYNMEPIPLEDHVQWFEQKLSDSNSFLFVGEYRGGPIGQIRFDLKERELIIGYAVMPNARGKGFGKLLLSEGITQTQQKVNNQTSIVGYVKKDNLASQRSFQSLGFTQEETLDHPNSYKFILKK
ncbi:MAG: UDP-2,4-diacetamido-2,4,6-trideoxy-beta-L-altropyranose hydrolase [Lewinellaceae bacterium]|nr:UDP-2,4-diacetamido-2,4,6-trideoxy-beta-L-altropyranose hydrolase [Lewinellaceae bacterium]